MWWEFVWVACESSNHVGLTKGEQQKTNQISWMASSNWGANHTTHDEDRENAANDGQPNVMAEECVD